MHAVYDHTPKEATTAERSQRIQETLTLVDKLGGSVCVLCVALRDSSQVRP